MTRVRLEDLSPKARAQLAERLDEDTKRRTRTRDKVPSDHDPCPGHCHNCGEAFPTAAAWFKHADTVHAGNARWDIDSYTTTPTTTPTPTS